MSSWIGSDDVGGRHMLCRGVVPRQGPALNLLAFFDQITERYFCSSLFTKQPDGYGCEQFPDGSVYGGQFQSALRHGIGRFQNTDYYYAGQWKEGLRHGVGVELECNEKDELVPRIAIYIMWVTDVLLLLHQRLSVFQFPYVS